MLTPSAVASAVAMPAPRSPFGGLPAGRVASKAAFSFAWVTPSFAASLAMSGRDPGRRPDHEGPGCSGRWSVVVVVPLLSLWATALATPTAAVGTIAAAARIAAAVRVRRERDMLMLLSGLPGRYCPCTDHAVPARWEDPASTLGVGWEALCGRHRHGFTQLGGKANGEAGAAA